jgi:hypothetical protein
MPMEEYAKLGFPGADELAEMFKVSQGRGTGGLGPSVQRI